MKIVAGAWINAALGAETLVRKLRLPEAASERELRDEILALSDCPRADLGDFGRGAPPVRRMMLAALLCAWDFGGKLPGDTGVVGWNGSGCAAEDLRFWRDYTDAGKTAGRGGLFVPTLPTIPGGEAAIALGCHGPSFYLRTAASTAELGSLLAGYPEGLYLAGELFADSACALLIGNRGEAPGFPDCATLAELFRTAAEEL